MAERYEVSLSVVSQKGTCAHEHKVGDQWVIERKIPEDICPFAWNALFPRAQVLMFGGTFPWADDPDVAVAACPDPNNPVVFELRRLRE